MCDNKYMENYYEWPPEKYMAFMESVCKVFNCCDAIPPLKEGFKTLCEAGLLSGDDDFNYEDDEWKSDEAMSSFISECQNRQMDLNVERVDSNKCKFTRDGGTIVAEIDSYMDVPSGDYSQYLTPTGEFKTRSTPTFAMRIVDPILAPYSRCKETPDGELVYQPEIEGPGLHGEDAYENILNKMLCEIAFAKDGYGRAKANGLLEKDRAN
jgi:hypothetical protein